MKFRAQKYTHTHTHIMETGGVEEKHLLKWMKNWTHQTQQNEDQLYQERGRL